MTSPKLKPAVSAPRNDGLLRQARVAQQAGDRNGALRLLRRAANEDPANENIWLLAATLAHDSSEAAAYVERALRINPSNDRARGWIKSYRTKKARQSTRPAPTPKIEAPPEAPAGVESTPAPQPTPVPAPPVSNAVAEPPAVLRKPIELKPSPAMRETPVPAPAISPSRLAWHCPLCRAGAEERRSLCSECGAATDLDNIDAIARNDSVDEERVSAAGRRLEEALAQGPDFDAHVALALVYLNLKRSPTAMKHLAAAADLSPDETKIKEALRTLKARKLVLVADETLEFREWLRCLLESYRVRVETCSDGMKALGVIEHETPDLIFVSATLPGLHGYGLCKSLHKSSYTKGVPVVITAKKGGLVEKARGKTAGARETITRKLDPGYAIRTVKKHIPSSYLPDPELEYKNMFKM